MFDRTLFERLERPDIELADDPILAAIMRAVMWDASTGRDTAETLLEWLKIHTSLERDYDPDDEPELPPPAQRAAPVMKESIVVQSTLDGAVRWTREDDRWRREGTGPWPPPVPPSPSGVLLVEADMRRRASEDAWAPRNELGQIVKDPRSDVHYACLLQETEGRCLHCGGRPDSPLHTG